MTSPDVMPGKNDALRSGVRAEIVTIVWMIVEAGVAVGSGIAARSVLLTAFGIDSVIELLSGGVLLWRLRAEVRGESTESAERRAGWLSAVLLLLLCLHRDFRRRRPIPTYRTGSVPSRSRCSGVRHPRDAAPGPLEAADQYGSSQRCASGRHRGDGRLCVYGGVCRPRSGPEPDVALVVGRICREPRPSGLACAGDERGI